MKKTLISVVSLMLVALMATGAAFAMDAKDMDAKDKDKKDMAGHDMDASGKIGKLFHKSTVDGYMLSYYLMDLRDQKKEDMDKPHHIMVYIMDKDHKKVLEGKVGFMIKDSDGNDQKAMGMYMSEGFGITANMKKKGMYTIVTKALVGDVKLMDKFTYEMK